MEMDLKEQIAKIKKHVRVFHIVVTLLLVFNAIVWFFTLFKYYSDDFILLIVGLSCVTFLIAIVIIGIFIEKRIKRNLKDFVEKFAGRVSYEDINTATELLKKWKKHFASVAMKESFKFSEITGKEKYPFGNQILEDLASVKKGIKVEIKAFYALLANEDFGDFSNQLLSKICCLINNNSYLLDN